MKAHVFLIITPTFQPQIHYTLKVKAENVPSSGIPIFIFLCKQPHPQCQILVFCPGEKIKSQLEVNLRKMCLVGQGQSI